MWYLLKAQPSYLLAWLFLRLYHDLDRRQFFPRCPHPLQQVDRQEDRILTMLILAAEDVQKALPMPVAVDAMKEAFAALSECRTHFCGSIGRIKLDVPTFSYSFSKGVQLEVVVSDRFPDAHSLFY